MIMRNNLSWLLLIALSQSVAWGNPHDEAADCRLSSALSALCLSNCVQCHENSNPIIPLDIYVKGDLQLCAQCHPQQAEKKEGTLLLRFVNGGGGNHKVEILYFPEGSRTALVPSPAGPKLFTDEAGENPKIYCSSCHDPMSRSGNLLRVDNRGSALCLSCHQK